MIDIFKMETILNCILMVYYDGELTAWLKHWNLNQNNPLRNKKQRDVVFGGCLTGGRIKCILVVHQNYIFKFTDKIDMKIN